MSVRRFPALAAATWLAIAIGAPATAQTPTAKPSAVDPHALELVRSMSAALAGAKALAVDVEIVFDEVMHSGRKLQFAAAALASVRRPNGLAVEYLSDLGGKRLWYDGKSFTLLDVLHDVYATGPAPATTHAFLEQAEARQGVSFPLIDFFADDPAARLLGDVKSAFVVGPGDVGGKTCQHLAFSTSTLDWQVWIDAGEKPLPCKVVITYRQRPSAPQYAAVFSEWEFPRSIDDDEFVAALPEKAHRVEFLPMPNAAAEAK